ncbi:zinc-binding dehydrogenase [Cellulomonas sp. RIT-PI-Y]|uniref:zinc-dependent alcohol dehydrogenase n=1 Tax=Cellulomonas sp. RIT-PI-Y TaxID=3035297 RepID=UPI0021D92A58|nr:zinc-binding dehydrogenase [Cellulomonas sp. RIT-PI-Y]
MGEHVRVVVVTGPGAVDVREIERPRVGPRDVLLQVRACGVCGSDGFYIARGGIPPREGATPLGHEIAAEVIEVGHEVEGLRTGNRVVVDPTAAPSGIIGNGGALGGLADLLLIEDAAVGVNVAVVPDDVPWEVAALNEPMAVAKHAVNRLEPQEGEKAVVFGAGPIGLGALIDLTRRGVDVVVVDVVPSRLDKALQLGASAVVNSADDDLGARLAAAHGEVPLRPGDHRPGTDMYLDAAGAPAVIEAVQRLAKHGARLSIAGVHKQPVPVDFGALLSTEITISLSRGYPTEIFEVTRDIVQDWRRYQQIISHRIPFDRVVEALRLAATPGAAEKVVVTFGADEQHA